MASKIEVLGGKHYSDLMSDVTYLIVGDRNTEKYRFCIRNRPDVKFITVESVLKVHHAWINGEEDPEELNIDKYPLSIFHNINICFSRIDLSPSQISSLLSSKFRHQVPQTLSPMSFFTYKNLTTIVSQNGGKSTESLSLTSTCVVSTESRGKRYTKALEWGKPVLHPMWIFDSLIRGAALDFDDYVLTNNPLEMYEHGCSVWSQIGSKSTSEREEAIPVSAMSTVTEPKKINKLKRGNTNDEIWNSIMDKTKTHSKREQNSDNIWDETNDNSDTDNDNVEDNVHKSKSEQLPPPKESQLFLGFNFLITGFSTNESTLLSKAVENLSGEVTNDNTDDSITHIILPATKGAQSNSLLKIMPQALVLKITNGYIKVVTEWFVERSMYYKRVMTDRWCVPMKGLAKSRKRFKICITGFTGIEQLHIEKLIKFFDFEYCLNLNSKRDLLIVNINLFQPNLNKTSPQLFNYKHKDIVNCPVYQSGNNNSSVAKISSRNKINAAKNWNIPIVSIAYLWEIMELSMGKPTLIMPDLTNLQWCLFAPSNYSKPKSLLEYVTNLQQQSSGSGEEKENDTQVKLPSPRKAKLKTSYGRLGGGGVDAQSVANRVKRVADDDDEQQIPDSEEGLANITNIDEEDDEEINQVRYQDTDSIRNEEQLMRKLGETEESEQNAQKRRRTRRQYM
ncbi:S-M checkpoint control protein rad4 [Spathaspora sp. JA1]|nr:S-M checkpoint control protein rad4 [Spathaspora sp. JA1]